MRSLTELVTVWRVTRGCMEMSEDVVVVEHELEIVWNGRTVIRLACTPEYLAELTGGFLLTSGYVSRYEDIDELFLSASGERCEVETLAGSMETLFELSVQSDGCLSRPVPRLSRLEVVESSSDMEAEAISGAMRHLQESSQLFRSTGGAHVAALARSDGTLAVVCEDIGRHNAVDKVAGMMLLRQVEGVALVLSGRISSDIVQKAARMRLPLVVSRSAPTHGAIRAAQGCGITLVGFARGKRLNVYTHKERIVARGDQ